MNGNIVGEPIDGFVQLQISARQSAQFSGYENAFRTPEQLQYLNNRNAWIKLASSVTIVNPNRLSDIGIINPLRFVKNYWTIIVRIRLRLFPRPPRTFRKKSRMTKINSSILMKTLN